MRIRIKSIALLIIVLVLNCTTMSLGTTITSPASSQRDIDLERRRQMENEMRELNENPGSFTTYPLNEIEEPTEVRGSQIRNISIIGNEILSSKEMEELKHKYIGKYGGENVLNCLRELENLYLDKGYVTTRVKLDMENSDMLNGEIVFVILHGKIENITLNESNYSVRNRAKIWSTLPLTVGDIINIKDLDQAMDNLNSINSNDAVINVNAGEEVGTSTIDIVNRKSNRISGGIGYNNLGQKYTGEYRGRIFLTFEDILGMNDSFTGIYQRKLLKKNNGRNNESFFYYYRVPVGYWEFYVSRDESEYNTRLSGYRSDFNFSGESLNYNFGLKRVVARNEHGKYTLGAILITKSTKSYIEDIKLESSSRRLTILNLNFNAQRRLLGGVFFGSLNHYRGLDMLGADKKLNDNYAPEVLFSKHTIDLNYYRYFSIKNYDRFLYRLNFFGQYSDDILYSSEKLTIGDDSTVRGFKNNSVMGDKGFYVRNEISYNFGHLEPFVSFDIGKVKNKYKINNYNGKASEISGVSVGVRGKYKNLEMTCTYSKGLSAPDNIEKENHIIYFSTTMRF